MYPPMLMRFVRLLLPAVLCLVAVTSTSFAANEAFVRPAALEPDIAFWRRIYTEVTTDGGLIHDPERLDVVYEVLEFPDDLSPRQRSKLIEDSKGKYARILEKLADGAEDLTREEQRVSDLWPKGTRR